MILLASLALATDHHVEAGGLDFASALLAATDGDRLIIHGTVNVPSDTLTTNLTIEGADPGATLVLEDELIIDAEVEMQHVTFSGAAVRCLDVIDGAELVLLDVGFVGCQSGVDGGAVGVTDAALIVAFSTFRDNLAPSSGRAGAAVYCHDASCTFTDSLFEGNTADGHAGAIGFGGTAQGTVLRSRFCDNVSGDDGGAIRGSAGTSVTVTNSLFLRNMAGDSAGAILLDGGDAIDGSTFLANTSQNPPGQVELDGASSSFSANLIGNGATSQSALALENSTKVAVMTVGPVSLPSQVAPTPLTPAPSTPTTCSWEEARLVPAGDFGVQVGIGADVDGDEAFVPEDCDDDDPAVSPTAEELCDGIDQDCDGAVDELGCARCRAVEQGGSVYQICEVAVASRAEAATYCDTLGVGYGLIDIDDKGDIAFLEAEVGSASLYVAATYDGVSWRDGDGELQDPAPPGVLECGYWQNLFNSRDCSTPATTVVCERCDGGPGFTVDGDGDGYGDVAATTCVFGPGLALAGGDCDDTDPTRSVDGDGDGVDPCADCNDADPDISPLLDEVACNGVDDDCDPGTPDVTDLDDDGIDSCSDCDDADPTVGEAPCDTTPTGHTGTGDDDDDDDTVDTPCEEGDTGCEPALTGGVVAPGCRCDGSGGVPGWLVFGLVGLVRARRR